MLLILSLYLTWPGIRRPDTEKGKHWTSQTTQKDSQATETVNTANTTAINRPRP